MLFAILKIVLIKIMKLKNFIALPRVGAFGTIFNKHLSLEVENNTSEYFPKLAKHKLVKTKLLEVN